MRPRRAPCTIALVLALAAIGPALPHTAVAQDASSRQTGKIADHRFMETEVIPLPILTTNFLTSLGVGGASNLEVEIFDRADSLPSRTIEGDLVYLTLRFAYQQRVNEWLAPWLSVDISGRIGTNSVSLLSEGVAYQYAWEFGWLLRLKEWERSRLAATVSLGNANLGLVAVDEWLRDILDNGGIEEQNELYSEAPSLRVGGGLRYAHAINAVLGLAAVAEGGVGEAPNATSEARGIFRAGILGDVNLDAANRIPLGLAVGYQFQSGPGIDPGVRLESHQGIVRLEYTGRQEYAVAIETQFGTQPLTSGESTLISQTKLVTRYYF